MSRPHTLPCRLLALAAFFALATSSATVLADVPSPELAPPLIEAVGEEAPAEEPAPEEPKTDDAKTDDAKKDDAKKDDAKKDDAKKDDDKKDGACSVVDNDDRILGLAGIVLLLSGLALRRRRN